MDYAELFDGLAKEIFYGFNCRLHLLEMEKEAPEDFAVLVRFVRKCKNNRMSRLVEELAPAEAEKQA